MLLELIASLSLLALVVCSIADAHRSLASLMKSSKSREEREVQQFESHLVAPDSSGPACVPQTLAGTPLLFWRCEAKNDETGKPAVRRFIEGSAGFSLIEVLFTLGLFSIVLISSYPSLRLSVHERMLHERIGRIERGMDETLREIYSRAASASLTAGPGGVQLFDGSSAVHINLRGKIGKLEPAKQPHPDSSVFLTIEPFSLWPLAYSSAASETKTELNLSVCGHSLPKRSRYLSGVSPEARTLFEIVDYATQKAGCGGSDRIDLFLKRIDLSLSRASPGVLYPLRRIEAVYLDRNSMLRRYLFEAGRSEPLLYGVERFEAKDTGGAILIELAAGEKDTTRSRTILIPRRSPNIAALENLAL